METTSKCLMCGNVIVLQLACTCHTCEHKLCFHCSSDCIKKIPKYIPECQWKDYIIKMKEG